ncbi:MAG: ISL3 family transposase [Saprospiraceae bacterium]
MAALPLELLPDSESTYLQSLTKQENVFVLELNSTSVGQSCPECGEFSAKVHSYYSRDIQDLPWAAYVIQVNWKVRKFYCENECCFRKVFCERLGEAVDPYARRTKRLNQHLNTIGFALGGNMGSKLASLIGMPLSSSTMLRIIYRIKEDKEITTPRALGIDDWAFRKGINYGTILVDLEKRKPIDLLPYREMETVKKWLEDHPGIEIISRDRASCYSQAAKLGAPQAIQVADRWHLLKNLGEALKRMLDKHNVELNLAAKDIAQASRNEEIKLLELQETKVPEPEITNDQPALTESLSKAELSFLEVKRLTSEGYSIRSIHRQTGLHRQTIKRYMKYEEYPGIAVSSTKPSLALPFEPYLRKRWVEGQTNHKELWREIKEQGFTGSSQSVYRLVSKYPKDPNAEKVPPPLAVRTWSAQKVSLLLSKPFEEQNKETQAYLRAFYKRCPEANQASQLARKFKEMTDQLRKKRLDPWINRALECGIPSLRNFAKGLQQDYDAVKAAVSLKWSNGQASS